MRRALLVLLLAAACSSGSPTVTPSPSASPAPTTPYDALTPPRSPGIGAFEAVVANRAYAAAQGLLAEALLERGSVTGADDAQLVTDLGGTSQDTVVRAALSNGSPAGLDFRPRFAASVTVPSEGFAEVVRSQWGGEAVTGRAGETALRITWSGAVRYRVTHGGAPVEVAYALTTAWLFEPSTDVPGELSLITTQRGRSHIAPQPPACTAKGVIVPAGSAPVEADFGPGPYPTQTYPETCPLTK